VPGQTLQTSSTPSGGICRISAENLRPAYSHGRRQPSEIDVAQELRQIHDLRPPLDRGMRACGTPASQAPFVQKGGERNPRSAVRDPIKHPAGTFRVPTCRDGLHVVEGGRKVRGERRHADRSTARARSRHRPRHIDTQHIERLILGQMTGAVPAPPIDDGNRHVLGRLSRRNPRTAAIDRCGLCATRYSPVCASA